MLQAVPEDLFTPDAKLVVALSGGLDSTVLLHLMVQWQQQHPQASLRALHVHHGLSANADSWAQHCLSLCQQWQIAGEVLKVEVDGRAQGIEAAARQARYAAMIAALNPDEILLTAQHQDDQCETLLLALKRGSGPAGLAAMPQRMRLAGHPLVRPLLDCSRQQLEAYAEQWQLRWIEDESNQDTRYDRNFLRQCILPQLQQRWPQFAATVSRSAALCGEQEQLLDELLTEQLAALIQPDGSLLFTSLLTMSEARRNALLRRWVASQGGEMPSRAALSRITHEVMLSREDAQPRLQLGRYEIRRFRQQLWWLPLQPSLRDEVLFWPDQRTALVLPSGLGCLITGQQPEIRRPESDEVVSVRFQAQGHFHLLGRSGGREMKKLWQEMNIPPWQRERVPLIYYNQTLICAPGLFVTREGAANALSGWQAIWKK